MGLAARREREREEIREKILAVARQLLSERGFEGLTMREIARRIEYSPTVIYSHFKDKQALVNELVDEDYRAVGQRMQALRQIADPLARLRYICERFTEYALANPNHYRAIVMTPGPEAGASVHDGDIRADAYALVLDTVKEAITAGRVRAERPDPALIAQTFIAGIHGVISLHLTLGHDSWIRWRPVMERSRLMLDALLQGLTGDAVTSVASANEPPRISGNLSNT